MQSFHELSINAQVTNGSFNVLEKNSFSKFLKQKYLIKNKFQLSMENIICILLKIIMFIFYITY